MEYLWPFITTAVAIVSPAPGLQNGDFYKHSLDYAYSRHSPGIHLFPFTFLIYINL